MIYCISVKIWTEVQVCKYSKNQGDVLSEGLDESDKRRTSIGSQVVDSILGEMKFVYPWPDWRGRREGLLFLFVLSWININKKHKLKQEFNQNP